MPPRIDPTKCITCGVCASICPMQIFYHPEKGKIPNIRYAEECWHCNACVLDCPAQAISLRLPLNYMVLHVDADSLHK